jgi:hypothetical protein
MPRFLPASPTPALPHLPMLLLAASIGLAFATGAHAQMADDGGFLSAPAVPTPPRRADRVEPEVTIIETDEEVIYEYRVKGRVYMVKIQPIVGPPYYLLDTNGDGTLDVQESHEPNIALPQWLLFSW